MKEEIITLNEVEFRINGEKLVNVNNKSKIHKQNLHSWKWFYSSFETNLVASRYHKTMQVKNGENVLVDRYVSEEWNQRYLNGFKIQLKAISFSKRFKEDRIIYNKINNELIDIQKEQDKYYQYKTKTVN